METVANQDVVEVHKELCDTSHIYAKINIEAMSLAMKMPDCSLKRWLKPSLRSAEQQYKNKTA